MRFFRIPQNQEGASALGALWSVVIDLANDIESFFGVTIHDVQVGTTETVVAHGQRYTPGICIPVARGSWKVYQTRQPDERNCYLAAESAVVCDLRILR